ncbi:hypothetical protein K440DRAFT_619873 [Wilcoxina mikolae CBS 423.85]|nr:hypothetical protein K440DRAFT_619873 [Wilcoxina mikolae CBS 423.85]
MRSPHHFILLFLVAAISLVTPVFPAAVVETKDVSVTNGLSHLAIGNLHPAHAVSKIVVRDLNTTTGQPINATIDGPASSFGAYVSPSLPNPIHSLLTSFRPLCYTSMASPTFSEIEEVIRLVKERRLPCKQRNRVGSKCTTLVSYFGGQLGICGTPTKSMDCSELAWGAR